MRFQSVAAIIFIALLAPANAFGSYTSAVVSTTATMTGDSSGDTLTISQAGGLFRHNRFTAGDPGFASDFDFDSSTGGDQTLSSTSAAINISAGDGNDTITLADGINLRGSVDGGIGTDTIDYSAYTTAVTANLGLSSTGLAAALGADQEIPPTTHAGTATATISNYSITAHTFDISITATNLPATEVTGFHIHQGAVGTNGSIILDLAALGTLVPSGSGFTYNATGLTLPAASEAALLGGLTYVNIHTSTFSNGAIRGQLFSNANSSLGTGAATGTTSITGIENVNGGSGNDSLVGSSSANVINGNAGADILVGGPGGDTQNGNAGADIMVWSNGDGSDVDEGGSESDTVQVNGSVSAADVFATTANSSRLAFARSNLGPFTLDIGTTETLTVNGIGGDDTFTVGSLIGVSNIATVNSNGFDGNDTFTFSAASAGSVSLTVNGGNGTDSLQGPDSVITWNLTAANEGNLTGLVSSFRFIETLLGGTAADTFNVKAFATGAAMTVTGGSGTDIINYDAGSVPVSGDTTPPDGVFTSTGLQSVTFTQVETANITNPQPTIAINDVTVAEGGNPTNAVFNVTLSNASVLTVTVEFATANGTASSSTDYTTKTGSVTFAPGDLLKTITVPITVDGLPESAETFVVNLTNPTNATITDAQGQATITDADVSQSPQFDFNGDGLSDLTVFRPSSGLWFNLVSLIDPTNNTQTSFGQNGDVPVPADWDQDGKADLAVFRPSVATWFIQPSGGGSTISRAFGAGTDTPVPGDYDGDRKPDFAVYRPSTGVWTVLTSASSFTSTQTMTLGRASDVPLPGDYDGDGITDAAIFRPSTGDWVILTSSSGYTTTNTFQWGLLGDIPVVGDFDFDGITDLTVYRPTTGTWFVRQSKFAFAASSQTQFGLFGDKPVPAEYDGDGKTDLAVYRPSSGTWFISLSGSPGTTSFVQWGLSTDTPIPNSVTGNAIKNAHRTVANRLRTADFDGDGHADVNVFRPSNGTWFNLFSSSNYTISSSFQFGLPGDIPASNDYDGDSTSDLAVFRPSTGTWFLRRSSSSFTDLLSVQWGLPGDVPVPGDYDEDGIADLAVWRSTDGVWYIKLSTTSYTTAQTFQWGLPGDVPVPGDYDKDGVSDLAVYRPSNGKWFVRLSSTDYATSGSYTWGSTGDIPVPGDYDSDGATDLAVWRPSNGRWLVRQSSTDYATSTSTQWGFSADNPVPNDFDGDGKLDLAVFRPSNNTWFLLFSGSDFASFASYQWGLDGDIPILPSR